MIFLDHGLFSLSTLVHYLIGIKFFKIFFMNEKKNSIWYGFVDSCHVTIRVISRVPSEP